MHKKSPGRGNILTSEKGTGAFCFPKNPWRSKNFKVRTFFADGRIQNIVFSMETSWNKRRRFAVWLSRVNDLFCMLQSQKKNYCFEFSVNSKKSPNPSFFVARNVITNVSKKCTYMDLPLLIRF